MRQLSRRELFCAFLASIGVVEVAGLSACSQNASTRGQSQQNSQSTVASSIGKPSTFVTSFVVMSDTHVNGDIERNNEHFAGALADIRSFEPRPAAIVINGDITDNAFPEQYELVHTICEEEGFDFASDFVKVMGNHDQYSEDFDSAKTGWDEQYVRFMDEAGVPSVYYDTYVDGLHFICLGPDADSGNWVNFSFSAKQIEWLRKLLDEDEEAGRTSYVFCHEPLLNTVRNTSPDSWAGTHCIADESGIRSALKSRSRLVYFSGHTHLYPDIARPDQDGPLYVNDGAVGPGQIAPGRMDYPEAFSGSYGWLVSVFEDRIEFKARNFLEREWIRELEYVHPI